MDKEGMKFLDKIFKDLYKEKSVSKYESNKYQNIDKYMKKLTRISNGNHKKLLIKILLDNYVIKEENIPNDKDKINIISSQRNRLEEWLTYLTDVGNYPIWIKYWIFRSLIKIGTYSEIDGTYQVRSKKTLAPFIELNAEALAHTVEAVTSNIKGTTLNDEEIDKLVKSGSFKKIYTYYLEKLNEKLKTYGNEGTWVKYNQGTSDYIKLSESLKEYNTGWCTASSDMAKSQLCGQYSDAPNGGDFYVYYSIDENGLYKIPRIAIRMIENNKIGEIRGTDKGQNLEFGLEDILESKLDEMSFLSKEDKENCLQKINNNRHISNIISKNLNGETLSIDDIRVIYGLKGGETFGWETDSKLKNIMKNRNHQTDFDRLDKDDKVQMLLKYDLKILCSDSEVLLETIKQNDNSIRYADARNIENYDELAMLAIKQDWLHFTYVDVRYIKNYDELAMLVVKQDGLAIEYVDPSLATNYEAIALEAVKEDGLAIEYVDPSLVTNYEAIALEAVKQDGYAIDEVDSSLITNYDVLALEAVKESSYAIGYVDPSLVTNYEAIALEVVKETPSAIRSVDESYIKNYDELAKIAVKQNLYVIKDVDPSLVKDYNALAKEAVKKDGLVIDYVDKSYITNYDELAKIAVKQNLCAIKYVDPSLIKDYDTLAMETVKKDGLLIGYVDKSYIKNYDKLALEAVKQNSCAIEYVDPSLVKDYNVLVKEAIKQKLDEIRNVHENLAKKI